MKQNEIIYCVEGDYEYIETMDTNIRNCEIEEDEEWEFAEEDTWDE